MSVKLSKSSPPFEYEVSDGNIIVYYGGSVIKTVHTTLPTTLKFPKQFTYPTTQFKKCIGFMSNDKYHLVLHNSGCISIVNIKTGALVTRGSFNVDELREELNIYESGSLIYNGVVVPSFIGTFFYRKDRLFIFSNYLPINILIEDNKLVDKVYSISENFNNIAITKIECSNGELVLDFGGKERYKVPDCNILTCYGFTYHSDYAI